MLLFIGYLAMTNSDIKTTPKKTQHKSALIVQKPVQIQ